MTDEKFNGKGWAEFEYRLRNKFALGRINGRSEHSRAVDGKMADMMEACKAYDETTIAPISEGLIQVNYAVFSKEISLGMRKIGTLDP